MNPFTSLVKKATVQIKPPQPVTPLSPTGPQPQEGATPLPGEAEATAAAAEQQKAQEQQEQALTQAQEAAQQATSQVQEAEFKAREAQLENQHLKAKLDIEKSKGDVPAPAAPEAPKPSKTDESALLASSVKRTTQHAAKALNAVQKMAAVDALFKSADFLQTVKSKAENLLKRPETFYSDQLPKPTDSKPVFDAPAPDGTTGGLFRRHATQIANAPFQAARDWWDDSTYDLNKSIAGLKDKTMTLAQDAIRTPFGVAKSMPSAFRLAKENKPYEAFDKLKAGWNYGGTKYEDVQKHLDSMKDPDPSSAPMAGAGGLNTLHNFNANGSQFTKGFEKYDQLMPQPEMAYQNGMGTLFPMLATLGGVSMSSAYSPFRGQEDPGFLPEIDPYTLAQLTGRMAQNGGYVP